MRVLLAFTCIAVVVSLFCLPLVTGQEPSAPATDRPHVVLITVDTLRADHLSSYGYHLRTSPRMDQLASEGVLFEQAYCTIPMTGPSHFSMFTGRYPQEHGARINGVAIYDDSKWLTLPQVLRRFGYKTGAFVSAWPLIGRLTNLNDHFDHYDDELTRTYQVFHSMRWAEDVTPSAKKWLDANKDEENIFMWVHYFDPHEPYNLRKDFSEPEQIHEPNPIIHEYDKEVHGRILNYDSEIGYTDEHIGDLLDHIDRLGMSEDTLVVLVSDHGEGLGEQGFNGHGRWLYESVVRVPWIMRMPGKITPGTTIPQNVTTLDLSPTILDLVVPEYRQDGKIPLSFAGESLLPAITEAVSPSVRQVRFVSYEGKKGFMPKWLSWMWRPNSGTPHRVGMLNGSMKIIWTPHEERFEMFDLDKDPHELNPETLEAGQERYKFEMTAFQRWLKATDLAENESRMTEKDARILESLGYITR